MATKHTLSSLLAQEPPTPILTRGQGMRLSTDEQSTALPSRPAKPQRVNRGYALREELIMECKKLAIEQKRPLYALMEEALETYLKRHPQR